jgi:hypothetical protein
MEPVRCSEGPLCVGAELISPAFLRYVEQWKEERQQIFCSRKDDVIL